MNSHDVGRGRGGAANALAEARVTVSVAGIASDRLYPLALQEELAHLLPGGRPVSVIESESGHDGFLLEIDQVGKFVAAALEDSV
jgi:homoserine O-acetyltransferase